SNESIRANTKRGARGPPSSGAVNRSTARSTSTVSAASGGATSTPTQRINAESERPNTAALSRSRALLRRGRVVVARRIFGRRLLRNLFRRETLRVGPRRETPRGPARLHELGECDHFFEIAASEALDDLAQLLAKCVHSLAARQRLGLEPGARARRRRVLRERRSRHGVQGM